MNIRTERGRQEKSLLAFCHQPGSPRYYIVFKKITEENISYNILLSSLIDIYLLLEYIYSLSTALYYFEYYIVTLTSTNRTRAN